MADGDVMRMKEAIRWKEAAGCISKMYSDDYKKKSINNHISLSVKSVCEIFFGFRIKRQDSNMLSCILVSVVSCFIKSDCCLLNLTVVTKKHCFICVERKGEN